MKNNILKKAKEIAIPNDKQRKKVDKIANQVFSLVSNEAEKQKSVVSVHFGGSYAKETWTRGKIDIDIFVKFKKTTTEKNFEKIGRKIGFDSLKKFKPYVRYSEHPFVEANIDDVGVNVVPCYDVKKGEWKSAADRSTFHTEFMSEKLTGLMKDDIRVLKCFLEKNSMYGAEIAKQGFSGYVCEVLVYYLGSFEKVLKKIAKLQNNEMIGESPRKFESPMVLIDPIDRNRNLGAAISIENVTNFILIARNFLKKNSVSYFKEKSKLSVPKEFAKNMLVINFKYKKRSDDIIYGQIKRAANSIESQMNKEGFNVLRNDSLAYDENNASLIFLLESIIISKNEIRTGPEVFSSEFSSKFININSKKSKLMWTDKYGKLQSLQTRRYENAKSFLNDLIKNHIGESGIPKGLRVDFKTGFKISTGKDKQNISVKKSISRLLTTDDTAFSIN
ncbi:MAG: CCA tRNA nucleotidyltransferase [Candidatus Nitrosopelagicus sp.]|nr:CCA tRNA nucleotidyltransferase [Candidatus Nitrosopelagicus sp.]